MKDNRKLTAFQYYLIGKARVEEKFLLNQISADRKDKLVKELEDFVLLQEKKHIMDAYRVGKVEAKMPTEFNTTGGQYFNETFKQNIK